MMAEDGFLWLGEVAAEDHSYRLVVGYGTDQRTLRLMGRGRLVWTLDLDFQRF